MSIKKVLLAGVCSIVSAQAAQASVGGFAEVNVGGTSNWFETRLSPDTSNRQDKDIKLNKNAFHVGAGLGCDLTLKNKFYFGTKVYFLCNTAKGEKEEVPPTVVKEGNTSYRYDIRNTLKVQPLYSFGAAILVGGAITQNILVYAQCGVEGTRWKIENKFYCCIEKRIKSLINGQPADQVFKDVPGVHVSDTVLTGKFTGGMKLEKFYACIVPGIGAKYLFNNGMYVGVDCNVAIGIHPKDNKGLGGKSLTDKEKNTDFLDVSQLRMNSSVVLRYGLSLGYKF